jgi:hypothetical protein
MLIMFGRIRVEFVKILLLQLTNFVNVLDVADWLKESVLDVHYVFKVGS